MKITREDELNRLVNRVDACREDLPVLAAIQGVDVEPLRKTIMKSVDLLEARYTELEEVPVVSALKERVEETLNSLK